MVTANGDTSKPRTTVFWCVVGVLLVLMASVQFATVRRESQTYDESRQLLSGYTYLISGHFTVAREHPPLLKLLWAIPVWFLHPSPPHDGDPYSASADFLYQNRVPADTILMAGRCSAIAISALLGWTMAFWAKRHFGAPAALLAVFIYVLDPNFLAHGRYIKNDVGAALTIFAATMGWGAYLEQPTRKRLWLAGLLVGLALTTKSSALILWPVMLLLYVIKRWQQRRRVVDLKCVANLIAVAMIAFLVIFLVYGFEISRSSSAAWYGRIPIPAAGYFRGLQEIFRRQTNADPAISYLLGNPSPDNWWCLSLVALAVKTPLAELAFCGLALIVGARRLRTIRLRDLGFRWYLLVLPALCYFAASLVSRTNQGERHLLPILPFLFVCVVAILMTKPIAKWMRAAVAAGALALVMETASIHPHYLAFFNAFSGGPAHGWEYLVDSNLDWGQDLKNLKQYLDVHSISQVCVLYFGRADLDYYRVPNRNLPALPTEEAAQALDCVAAISVTDLALYHDQFAGLDDLQPDARIGYSIYVYDLRKQALHSPR